MSFKFYLYKSIIYDDTRNIVPHIDIPKIYFKHSHISNNNIIGFGYTGHLDIHDFLVGEILINICRRYLPIIIKGKISVISLIQQHIL